ncbi:MAG: MFS transporter [candidate division WOR-3 bacterium]
MIKMMKRRTAYSVQMLKDIANVWMRQCRNWKVLSIRATISKFISRIYYPYQSIYAVKLGASSVQLGILNSFGSIAGVVFSAPIGWLQDRYSLRKIFLAGLTLNCLALFLFALATNWYMLIPAIIILYLTFLPVSGAPSIGSCVTICDVTLKPEDRSTAKGICDGLFSLPGIAAPIVAALIISHYGGINAESIRILFWIAVIVEIMLLIFTLTQMTEVYRPKTEDESFSFVRGYKNLFKGGQHLKKWCLFTFCNTFISSMLSPFLMVYCYNVKFADEIAIGVMSAANILSQSIFSPLLGHIADKISRKKVYFLAMPLYWISLMMLLIAPERNFLLLALSWFLQGFMRIASYTVLIPLMVELVPIDKIGRWRGIQGMINSIAAIPAPTIGGIIWEILGPDYIILVPLLLSITVEAPLILMIPES